MLSDDERVFFEVDDRQDNRRRRNGLELFRAVDQETFRFTEIDFGEVKFYFGAVVGTLRQMRREKSRYLLGGATAVPTALDFSILTLIFYCFLCRLFRVLFFAVFECYFIRFSACFACFLRLCFCRFLCLFTHFLRFASASIASIYPSKPLPEIVLIA